MCVAMAVLGIGCSDGDTGDTTEPDDSPAADPSASGDEADAETVEPTRHVLLIGLDGLGADDLADPSMDLARQLGERGATLDIAATGDPGTGCVEAWNEALTPGGASITELLGATEPSVESAAFTTSDAAAAPLTTTSGPATVAGLDVPGLEAWPQVLLGAEQARDGALEHVAGVSGPSLTIMHTDALAVSAADPALVANGRGLAGDLVNIAAQAVTSRPTRSAESWLIIVSGGCSTDGTVPLLIEGDDLGTTANPGPVPPSTLAALLGEYLGGEAPEGTEVPSGLLAD
jgi:hypothetical protein